MPMQSRLVQLTLLGVLATGVILRRRKDFHAHLRKVKQILRNTRFEPDETSGFECIESN
jgi:RpiR family carbohydrate utilization transcriptional regulator